MPDPGTPELQSAEESFSDIFAQYEKANAKKKEAAEDHGRQIEATVVAVTADSVLFDIGFKSEGILPLTVFPNETIKPGDKLLVSVKGLSLIHISEPTRLLSISYAVFCLKKK